MDKKYQIFLSSTYEDLKSERDEVAKAILEIGDIPVGMEMFSAADETQWKLIQRQIEQSDYYIVIVAHRYGSEFDGVSYTEREYDYAVEIGVPVMGFILDSAVQWPPKFIDTDSAIKDRLNRFKDKVRSRMVSFWSNPDALAGRVLAALGKQKILSPRPGWMRAQNLPGPEILSEIGRLGKEVARLSEENSTLREQASIENTFSLVDSMVDDIECQALIYMYESKRDIPRFLHYVYRNRNGGGGSGALGGFSGKERLINAGMMRAAGGGSYLGLTELGKSFAEWLIRKGRKCDFLWTSIGGWGNAEPGSHEEQWVKQVIEQEENMRKPRPAQPPQLEAQAEGESADNSSSTSAEPSTPANPPPSDR